MGFLVQYIRGVFLFDKVYLRWQFWPFKPYDGLTPDINLEHLIDYEQ